MAQLQRQHRHKHCLVPGFAHLQRWQRHRHPRDVLCVPRDTAILAFGYTSIARSRAIIVQNCLSCKC